MEAVRRERNMANDDARHVRAQMVATVTSQMKGGDKLVNSISVGPGGTTVMDHSKRRRQPGQELELWAKLRQKKEQGAQNVAGIAGKTQCMTGVSECMGVSKSRCPDGKSCKTWVAWAKECEATLARKMDAGNEMGDYSYETG